MKLIILDRDGVINEDSDNYIKSPEEWRDIPGSLSAIAKLNQHGYKVVIISNQSGIGRKLFTIDTLNLIHMKMHNLLAQYDGKIYAVFFCPHAPEDNCNCRKPKPGLFLSISERLKTPLDGVYCVGDKMTDVEAAIGVGCTPILVRTGKGQSQIDKGIVPKNVVVYDDLFGFVNKLVSN